MFIPFEKLSPSATVWIYQSDKKFSENEKAILSRHLRAFTDQWLVHGAPLEASFDIRHDQFVILAANDKTSGCSIDTSVRVMKEAGSLIGVDFFNRALIGFLVNGEIRLVPLTELAAEFQSGKLKPSSSTFNNLVSTVDQLNKSWLVPAETTWLKRYLARTESVQ
jgi:hypothetical protein